MVDHLTDHPGSHPAPLPEELSGTNIAAWLQWNTATISLTLTSVPFAGIAFLWFMDVVRNHLGTLEDTFFLTMFFGSGLLFLSMIFVTAAIAGGILTSYAIERSLSLMLEQLYGMALGKVREMDIPEVVDDIGKLLYSQPFQIPAQFTFIGRAISTLVGESVHGTAALETYDVTGIIGSHGGI